MDRMIYLSMSGAKATMQRQDTLANNLANVSTVGFRAELRRVPRGAGAKAAARARASTRSRRRRATTRRRAPVSATGRNLDVAMKGAAWLAVQGLDGTEAYTRGGSLDVNAEGTLVTTAAACTVLGDGGPIQVPPDTQVGIAADGTVSADAAPNGRSTSIGKLKLVTPEAPLTRGTDGLFRAADGDLAGRSDSRASRTARSKARTSAPSRRWSRMIAAARQFEAQMKSLHDRRRQRQGRVAAAVGRLSHEKGRGIAAA